MEIEFISDSLLGQVKPCILLCGLDGQIQWASDTLRLELQAFHICEQEQFVPYPKQSVSQPSPVKQFPIDFNWLVNFRDRFAVIVELFLLGEPEMDGQLIEDVMFASKYANEHSHEHVAVICCESVSSHRMSIFRKDIRKCAFLVRSSPDLSPLISTLTTLANEYYKDKLVKKYKKRLLQNTSRFLAPWQCRTFYCFKSAVAFQAACENGNALREYHAAYSAMIEEGNKMVAKGESKRSLCEYTRQIADVILLRMVGCMFSLGSRKEAAAFLRGHIKWYSEAFEDAQSCLAWKVSMYCHYGWLMELLGASYSDATYYPALYYSHAMQLACQLVTMCPLGASSTSILNQVALSSIEQFESRPHRSIIERLLMIKFLYLTQQYETISEWIDQCLKVRSLVNWSKIAGIILTIAVDLRPDDIMYCWQFASIFNQYDLLEKALVMNHQEVNVVDLDTLLNTILVMNVGFDRTHGIIGQYANLKIQVFNNGPIEIPIRNMVVVFDDGHEIEQIIEKTLANSIDVELPFCVRGAVGEHSVKVVKLQTSKFAVKEFHFGPNSFKSEINSIQYLRSTATINVTAEEVVGIVGSEAGCSVKIDNPSEKPVHGVLKITKAPANLDVDATFAFGVSANGSNTIFIPMKGREKIVGDLVFDIDFSCEQHDCEPMTDLTVPVSIDYPLEVSVKRYRQVHSLNTINLDDLFDTYVSITATRKPNYAVECATVVLGKERHSLTFGEPFLLKDDQTKMMAIEFEIDRQRHEIEMTVPNIPYRPTHGFITSKQDLIVIVNEHPDEIVMIVEVEKSGQVFIDGPKRLTLTVPAHSFLKIPLHVHQYSDEARVTLLIDGQPAHPDWLIL